MVTVLLLNYRRQQNIDAILTSLKEQTVSPEIFLWNNADEYFEDERVDWVVNSAGGNGGNKGCFPRWFMAQYASNDFVVTLDDDQQLVDPTSLEIMLSDMQSCYEPGRILGLFGVQLNDSDRYIPTKTDKFLNTVGLKGRVNKHIHLPTKMTEVDIVKGRCMMVAKDDLKMVPLKEEFNHFADDLIVSHYLANGRKRHHRLTGNMKGAKMQSLEGRQGDMALSSGADWAEKRQKVLEYLNRH